MFTHMPVLMFALDIHDREAALLFFTSDLSSAFLPDGQNAF